VNIQEHEKICTHDFFHMRGFQGRQVYFKLLELAMTNLNEGRRNPIHDNTTC